MNVSNPEFFKNRLLPFVARKVKDRFVAEDIVHDVYLKVHQKVGQLRDEGKSEGWIFTITRNAIIDYFRKQSRLIDAKDLDWESDQRYLNHCVERCLQDMMATLPDHYREALELSDLQGVPQFEIARRQQISYSGAKSRVQRARQMLKEKMEEAYRIKLDQYGNVVQCEDRLPCGCPTSD